MSTLSHSIIKNFYSFNSAHLEEEEKMAITLFGVWPCALMSIILFAICSLSDCYDPLDPNGNITVTLDIFQWTTDGYLARVNIQNYYQYRHVDKPGWYLGWTWTKNEVIWSMKGAFATSMGNCSSFQSDIPHSCQKNPVIADLNPDQASPENMPEDCCRGGILYPSAINPLKSFSSFEIKVGNLDGNSSVHAHAPKNVSLMAPDPGYSCSPLLDVEPTVSSDNGGRRQVQVFRTWKSTCTYSSFLTNKTPMCCVSLSSFYNPTITACPTCSCGCRDADKNTDSCIRETTSSDSANDYDILQCTDHMCPIRVHWHVKNIYTDHWRVKLTVSNYNYKRNYTDWNVLAQHPGLGLLAKAYSFNKTLLPAVGLGDEVALFWGLKFYNDALLNAENDQLGSVNTELLLEKDLNSFTLRNGWAFPRRIYFNGENCQMPPPDVFPMLPNVGYKEKTFRRLAIALIILTSNTLL